MGPISEMKMVKFHSARFSKYPITLVLFDGLLLSSVLAWQEAQLQGPKEQRQQPGHQPVELKCSHAGEDMEARYDIPNDTTKYNDAKNNPDTYFHNGLDSYLHAITRPNKLLRISENGDITYSIRCDRFLLIIMLFI